MLILPLCGAMWFLFLVAIGGLVSVSGKNHVSPPKQLKFYVYDDKEWSKMGTFNKRPRDKTGKSY